ncbi:MAG: carbohydrate kinase family protein [Acidimicrobiales bacterium]
MVRMHRWDVISVGDTATDVFIRLIEGRVKTMEDASGRWLVFPFGDKLPFDHSQTVESGGNAANAAVAFARLGLSTSFATHVGDDQVGRDIQLALRREGVDTHLLRVDPGVPSNRNFVLWLGEDRTILVRHQMYDYHWPHLRPNEVPHWLYLSSVGSDAQSYYDQLVDWLESEPSVRLAFQPGTFQIAQGTRALAGLYRRANLLVCNREEAAEIGGGDQHDMADLLERLHRLGSRTVVVTDGPAGAFASDGITRYSVPCYPDPSPPIDRTGAGDAFAATLAAALAKGHALEEALAWAPVNAMSVVQHVGSQAGLLTEQDVNQWLERAPKFYTVCTW